MTALPPEVVVDLERENARLRAELHTARERQAVSAEILRTIATTSGDAERSLQQIAETTARLFGASSVVLRIAGDGAWTQTIAVGAGAERIVSEVSAGLLRIGARNLPGPVGLENRQIHVPDIHNVDPAFADWPGLPPARAAGTRVMAGTPLRRDGTTIGVLTVHRDRPVPFTEEELALQQSFADQAVIAIANSRLFNETQQALARQTATSDILRVISQSPIDVQPVFDAIVQTAVRLLGCDMAFVLRCDDTTFSPVAAATSEGVFAPRTPPNVPIDPSANFPSRAIFTKKMLHLPDWSAIDLPEHERHIQAVNGVNSALYLPLLREGQCIGLLTFAGKQANTFGASEIALAESFRDQALIAIENTRLFNETQEALERQTATADVLKVISRSAFDLDAVFRNLIETAARLCDAATCIVFRREGEVLVPVAGVGVTDEFMSFMRAQPMAIDRGTISGRAALERVTVHVPDIDADPEFKLRAAPLIGGWRSILAVPLLRDGEPVGILALARPTAGPFTQRQIELVETFADQAVIAIENVRLFQQVQTRTQELTRSLEDLRAAQDRLVQTEKLASLGQLTAGIAHEIKNPLNFVNNFAALSAELTDELNDVLKPVTLASKIRGEVDELTGLLKDNLGKVVQHGKRADSIVKNMLLHSREGSGEHRPADINALLDESLNLAYHGARAEKPQFNVTLQRDFDDRAGMIELFPQEITRVFLNLIANGFYAVSKRKTENGSSGFEPVVSASTRNLGNTVEIRIRDNGTGIPAEVREKMFNPFFTTKPAGEGTGLGLSMSHDIVVKQHGGTIDVETEPGQFTEFRIVLPRTSSSPNKIRGQT